MKTNRDKGLSVLKAITEKGQSVRAIVCGGDGSIMWLVEELVSRNIDTEKVPIGIVPLGTGNDFSQYLGWGAQSPNLTNKSFKNLKNLIRQWEHSSVQSFDIWDVKAQIFEYGKLEKVGDNFQNKLIQGNIFERTFCNYFSFGFDGKVGYAFDMHRTKSRIGNLATYGIMAILKTFTKTKTIDQLISGMEVRPQVKSDVVHSRKLKVKEVVEKENQQKIQEKQYQIQEKVQEDTEEKIHTMTEEKIVKKQSESAQQESEQTTQSQIIFKTKEKGKNYTKSDKIHINSGYCNLVALNIDSFMGGVTQIWKSASNAFESSKFKTQSSSDSQLQFVSFASSTKISGQKLFGGFAQRVAQGQGPYYFEFRQYEKDLKHRTYLQIDGQFIRITHPKNVSIKKSSLGKNGQIKVLRKKT